MNAEKLAYFKKRLEKMKHESEVQANTLDGYQNQSMRDALGELSTYDNHPGDLASEMERREVEGTLVRIEEDLLFHIDEALEAIRNGTYGICKICHKEIPLERLEALPEAVTCMEHINQ